MEIDECLRSIKNLQKTRNTWDFTFAGMARN